jgi:hypothetical protein
MPEATYRGLALIRPVHKTAELPMLTSITIIKHYTFALWIKCSVFITHDRRAEHDINSKALRIAFFILILQL